VSIILYRLGRASFRGRWRVVLAWVMVVAAMAGLVRAYGGWFDDTFEIPGAPSQIALDQLKMTFPQAADLSATMLVVPAPGTTMDSPGVRAAVEASIDRLEEIDYVTSVQTPYNEHLSGVITDDKDAGLVTIRVEGTMSTFTDDQRAELNREGEHLETDLPGSQVHLGGEAYSVEKPGVGPSEVFGIVVALVVLLITLGSLRAAVMPIVSGVAGAGLALMIILVSASRIPINSTTAMLALMLSLAVGMDYSLFIVSRHRDQLRAGLDVEESAAQAVATSGSAVVFAGLTVVIALLGMMVVTIPFLSIMGVFAAVAVAIEVLLALTLLPAMLGIAGDRLRPRPPKPRRIRHSGRNAARWVRLVTRVPLLTVALVTAALLALAMPATHMWLALPNSGHHQPTAQDRITYDLISDYFGPGRNGPLVVTASILEVDDPKAVIEGMRDGIEAVDGVAQVALAAPNPGLDTLMVQVIPTTGPDNPATADLVQRLRERAPTWRDEYGIDAAVTGYTAINIDVSDRLAGALAPFGAIVVGLSFALLLIVFRSVLVPLKAALGYLLSVGAAFGITTLVFNDGWARRAINLAEPTPLISFLPILLMGILFGLAMDYEVFLTSRIREEHVHGNDRDAVQRGFQHSAKVVVAAAVIMFAVFAFFVPMSDGPIKPIAFSLAVGVAIDAFVVRMTLGPALMALLGRHAWWIPRWLDRRLPVTDIEGESLAHQLRLRDWPIPDDPHLVYAERLAVTDGERTALDGLDLAVAPGDVLVIRGDMASRRALLLGLSGRLYFTGGEAKVLGHVLPEDAPVIRREVAYTTSSSPHFVAHLTRPGTRLLVVDDAHQLLADQRDLVLDTALPLCAEGGAVILGVATGASPDPLGLATAHVIDLPERNTPRLSQGTP